jgi:hypothetical protein
MTNWIRDVFEIVTPYVVLLLAAAGVAYALSGI